MEFNAALKINHTSNKIKRKISNIDAIKKLDELTGTNSFIIGFIAKSKEPVYQKDIEKHLAITRSTASKIISLMEKKELITRVSVNHDLRLKEIKLTNKALMMHQDIEKELSLIERKIKDIFTDTEYKNLIIYLDRISKIL